VPSVVSNAAHLRTHEYDALVRRSMLIALTAMGGWKDHKERNGQIYCTVDAAGCLQDEIAAQARNINGRYDVCSSAAILGYRMVRSFNDVVCTRCYHSCRSLYSMLPQLQIDARHA